MEFSAQQIADMVQGRVEGNPDTLIHTFSKIEQGEEGSISFISNPKYAHYIYETKASVVLVNEDFEVDCPICPTLIRVKNAYETVAQLLQLYESMKPKKSGIDSLAFVSDTATVGEGCYIGAFAYIGEGATIGKGTLIYPNAYIGDEVTLGDGCIVYPHAVVYHGCKLGNRVIMHSGSVVGADGFGFAPGADGYDKIPQIGIVTIEDDVEIGANTCIDRSTMGSTIVHRGVKLDNLVQLAHNTEVGEHTVMSSQVGVAGSTKIGSWCMFGGQVGISGHITIGDKVWFGAQSGVPSSVKSDQKLIGTPPMEQVPYFKSQAMFRRLPDMYKRLCALEKELELLKKQER
ncbi:MAG: UDP-3-O-(3-hydroxymyristoyl)glucosamine N-acyltransferase [Prevotella sp.]|nr:UDP-3-O-(3-hydroxymyristoyl)glucosamine N-acyltransferase [Prevotella sp.]